jgi:type III secretion protein C
LLIFLQLSLPNIEDRFMRLHLMLIVLHKLFRPRSNLLVGLLILVCATPITLFAAEMQWLPNKVRYVAEKKELQAFLKEFAAGQGVAVSIDPKVQGVLNGRYDLTPKSMMELIANTYGLLWYFDGKVIYISPTTDAKSEFVKLNSVSVQDLEQSLERLGISDQRYPIAYDASRAVAIVSGPSRFVDLALLAAKAIDRGPVESAAAETKTFQLRYAFADDYTVRQGNRDVRLPGIVSTLRQLYQEAQKSTPTTAIKKFSPMIQSPLEKSGTTKVRGTELTIGVPPALPTLVAEDRGGESQTRPSVTPFQPMFAADARTNVVVVRDLPERMASYEQTIRSLDIRPSTIEIDISIVEVSRNDFESLGIDWRFLSARVDVNAGMGTREMAVGGLNQSANTPAILSALPLIGSISNLQGGSLAAVLGNKTQLIARISALEEKGNANVRAHPVLMTINNVEASLDSMSTFYIPVNGFQDSQLFDVSVGTSIRITPSIVADDNAITAVRLLIKIEDGSITEQRVSQLPVVQRSSIGTQAVVGDGNTLVIAGYTQERESKSQTGVPILSSLPVVGGAFKSTQKSMVRVERLFMITPRVVELAVTDRGRN